MGHAQQVMRCHVAILFIGIVSKNLLIMTHGVLSVRRLQRVQNAWHLHGLRLPGILRCNLYPLNGPKLLTSLVTIVKSAILEDGGISWVFNVIDVIVLIQVLIRSPWSGKKPLNSWKQLISTVVCTRSNQINVNS